ncbi:MAG: hypothetical protein V4580_04920 [Bacteroidota bacterium]
MRKHSILLIVSIALLACNHLSKETDMDSSVVIQKPYTVMDLMLQNIKTDDVIEGEELGTCFSRKSGIYPEFVMIDSCCTDVELV